MESLPGVKLRKTVFLNAEEIRPDGMGRNTRPDILAVDENGTVYNTEMQGEHLESIPYRYRTNGSALDKKLIKKGIRGTVEILKKIGRTDLEIVGDITDQYQLSRKQAKTYLK